MGKSALADHLFYDLYAALDQREYSPSRDKYSYNALTLYFDTYDYKRVFEMQDFLQMRSPVANQLEIINLIRMGDETAYPLNMAACESKGAMFSASDFLYITSNHEFDGLQNIVTDSIFSWQAFTRRVDVHVQMQREMGTDENGFNKDTISFNHGGETLKYEAFIALLVREYRKKVARSSAVSSVHAAASPERIANIKALLEKDESQPPPRITCSLCAYTTQCFGCHATKQTCDPSRRFRLNSGLVDEVTFRRACEGLQVECNQKIRTCERCAEWRQDHLGALSGRWIICHDPEFARSGRTKHICSANCCRTNTYRQQIRTAVAQGGSDVEEEVEDLLDDAIFEVEHECVASPEELTRQIDAEIALLQKAAMNDIAMKFASAARFGGYGPTKDWSPPPDYMPNYPWAELGENPRMPEILEKISKQFSINVVFGNEEVIRDYTWTAIWKAYDGVWSFVKTNSSIILWTKKMMYLLRHKVFNPDVIKSGFQDFGNAVVERLSATRRWISSTFYGACDAISDRISQRCVQQFFFAIGHLFGKLLGILTIVATGLGVWKMVELCRSREPNHQGGPIPAR